MKISTAPTDSDLHKKEMQFVMSKVSVSSLSPRPGSLHLYEDASVRKRRRRRRGQERSSSYNTVLSCPTIPLSPQIPLKKENP